MEGSGRENLGQVEEWPQLSSASRKVPGLMPESYVGQGEIMHRSSHLPLPLIRTELGSEVYTHRIPCLITGFFVLFLISFYLWYLGVGQMRSLLEGLFPGGGDDTLRQQQTLDLPVRLSRKTDIARNDGRHL